ncbi:MAG: DUF1365 domain-containing protein [Phenylobacterium sp.]|uniref:DUF1365 domain-containing protein n=1 Tax=Phenylobacterium sp. TaxID=1871053 RepID=UPI00391B9443
MSVETSGLYAGVVSHVRRRPRAHRLRYRIFMLLLDLDEIDGLARRSRLFARNRFGLLSFHDADHGDRRGGDLRTWAETQLKAAGLPYGGAIRILSMPRILGFGFNPLSVWFCHDPAGGLSAVIYEVNNTFGQKHSYLIPAPPGPRLRQACDKDFHVSPFMDMDLGYRFRIVAPGSAVAIGVDAHDGCGLVLAAAFAGQRRPLTDGGLLRAWLGHPWMTLGVLTAIHWEALKIWLKGERLRPQPPQPLSPVTIVPGTRSA